MQRESGNAGCSELGGEAWRMQPITLEHTECRGVPHRFAVDQNTSKYIFWVPGPNQSNGSQQQDACTWRKMD